MNAHTGLADLLRIRRQLDLDALSFSAHALGFRLQAADTAPKSPLPGDTQAPQDTAVPPDPPAKRMPVLMWRLESIGYVDDGSAPPPPKPVPRALPQATPLSSDELRGSAVPPKAIPSPPLEPWSRLWPRVRQALSRKAPTHEVDVRALVRLLGKGELPTRLPRVWRQRWAPQVTLIEDRDRALLPLRSDVEWLVGRIKGEVGETGVRRISVGGVRPQSYRFDEMPLLALTDLGVHSSDDSRALWRRISFALRHARHVPTALVMAPVPPGQLLPAEWATSPWQSAARAQPQALERLLTLVSTANYVEWPLFRWLRLQLEPSRTDASTELAVLRHADVGQAGSWGFGLKPEAARRRRSQLRKLAADDATSVKAAIQAIHSAHTHWRAELQAKETFAVMGSVDDPTLIPAQAVAHARKYAPRLAATPGPTTQDEPLAEHFVEWSKSLLNALPSAAMQQPDIGLSLRQLHVTCYGADDVVDMPPDLDPRSLASEPDPDLPAPETSAYLLAQNASGLVAIPLDTLPLPQTCPGRASPLGIIQSSDRRMHLSAPNNRQTRLQWHALDHALGSPGWRPAVGPLSILTNVAEAHVALAVRPKWAADWGRDRYGLWADLTVPQRGEGQPVRQRMRWIPPGRFWMGSPDDEPGRYRNEGPRHLVTITRGYWLADTPCTQELWEAVMGDNPSRFKTPKRPVESVNWHRVSEFVDALRGQHPDDRERWRLPTEAEWEYACRAGTETATYAGPFVLRGAHDAPVLDDIAWYGGNSGVGLEPDLPNAEDSSKWTDKQHPHDRAATREVKGKLPNAWGLFDSLGNVWEWCADDRRDYGVGPLVDPKGPSPSQADRAAVRGGAWFFGAGDVRAAFRFDDLPSFAWFFVGFRLARGQGDPEAGGARS